MATNAARRRLAALLTVGVLVTALAVFLVAQDGSDEPSPSPEEQGILPLLGTSGQVPQQAALAVKIDDTDDGRPQAGLAQADVVFEEMVEGGLTRLMAVYHSQDPGTVGPVRSARSTDVSLLSELGRPLFAWSGANPTFAALVESADLVDVGIDAVPDAYRRADDRRAPYNLFAAPDELRAAGGDDRTPPPQLFEYRSAGEALTGAGARAATGFRTVGDTLTTSFWEWDQQSGTWLRTQDGTPHVDADDRRIGATNVLIRETPYVDSGVRDSTGAVVPEAEPVGEGDVWLLSDGQAQAGRWQRPSDDAPTTYAATDGSPLLFTPGQTWIEVLPPGSGEVF